MREFYRIFTLMEAFFVIGISGVLLYLYYIRKDSPAKIRLVYFLLTVGYLLILICTIITVRRQVYNTHDYWYWLLVAGYTLSDIGLIIGLEVARKRTKDSNKTE